MLQGSAVVIIPMDEQQPSVMEPLQSSLWCKLPFRLVGSMLSRRVNCGLLFSNREMGWTKTLVLCHHYPRDKVILSYCSFTLGSVFLF